MVTAIDWPAALKAAIFEWGLTRAVVQFRSPVSSQFQAVDLLSEFWTVAVTLPPALRTQGGAAEAFVNQLVGGAQPVNLYHMQRQTPTGTMRGTPTLAVAAAQFAKTFQLSGASGTLLAGDLIGLGGQILQVAADTVDDGSGNMTVTTVNRIRSSQTIGAAVMWNKPTAQFCAADPSSVFKYDPDKLDTVAIALQEVPQ